MIRKMMCAALVLASLALGCMAPAGQSNSIPPVVFAFLQDRDASPTYGPDSKAEQKAIHFLAAHNSVLPDSNATHIAVQVLPFSRSESSQRPFDLRIVEAKLDVFINWIADGKVQFLPERMEQIPLEQLEDTLRQMCADMGIQKPTILRGMGWKDRKTHNRVAPTDP